MRPVLFAVAGLAVVGLSPASAADRPNIILVITDDQGYGDIAAHGNPVLKTPNLDRLRAESVRFSRFHVSPTCAPTRCALLTGRHEFRSGVTHTINERERMALTAKTYPEALKATGYTTGIFGKWHLGDEDAHQPDRRGFDEVFIHGAGGIGQTYPGSCGDAPGNRYFNPAILHNGRFEKTSGYCTDVFFDRALGWVEARAKAGGPFYCHIATNAPHAPLDCPAEYEAKYAGKVPANAAKFFGMVENIDDNVGKLLKKLADLGIEKNTVVVFLTDNGGTAGVPVFNADMRAQKGTPYLGGIRVPLFVRWPNTLAPADVSAVAAHLDLFSTFAELTGAEPPQGVKLDGRSLVPLLKNPKAEWPDRTLFTHVGRWPRGKAAGAKHANCSVTTARFQMVSAARSGEKSWELFDLTSDPGQKTNVIADFPDVARKLESAYDEWWASVQPGLVNEDADGPAENPFKTRYWKQFPAERPADRK